MRDCPTVRYVTTHYTRLQGLRLVPLGIPFLLSAAWRARWIGWWPGTEGRGAVTWFVALVAAAVLVSFPIRRWYERRFGTVRTRFRDNGLLPMLAFVALVAAAVWFQLQFAPRVLLPMLVLGLILAMIGWHDLPVRPHYIALGLAWAVFAWVQPLGVPPTARPVLFDLLVGGGLIVAGVGDHRALVRVLGAGGDHHARTV
jgi:hypothetical protein